MNNDDFKEVPDNIQDNNGETTNNIDNTNDNKSNDYEDVCYICRRPESVAGKMIHIQPNLCICNDCMQKTFDSMSNGNFGNLGNLGNISNMDFGNMPNISMINLSDLTGGIPNSQKLKKKKPKEEKKVEPILDIHSIPAPHRIKASLDDYVVGQEHAKKVMSVAVYNHYKRVMADNKHKAEEEKTTAKQSSKSFDGVEIEKSNMLMIGPTGSGKTYLVKTLAKLLEGSEVEVPVGASSKNAMVPMTTVDTRNILFICGGAFPGLEDIIKERLNKEASIGFKADLKDKYDGDENLLMQATVDDIRKFGMIPEFIGRLPIMFSLEALTEDMLVKILKEPKNAIIKQYQKLLEMDEVRLEFDDDALYAIAKMAKEKKVGARALRAIIEDFMLDIMYEIPKDDNIGTVTITKDYVEKKGGPLIQMRGTPELADSQHV